MGLLDNAKSLYIKGIGKGNYEEAIEKYAGMEYVQHSTGVETGKLGFKKFFADFTKRHPVREMKIIHSFQNEKLAFLFVVQNLNGRDTWLTMDIFAGDQNNKLIEHWDIIEEFTEPINHQFKLIPNKKDLIQIVSNNLVNFGDYTSAFTKKTYEYNEHICYQILKCDNYVAMLSGFNSQGVMYAQISLLEFDQEKLIGYWSTTEINDPATAKNSGKF